MRSAEPLSSVERVIRPVVRVVPNLALAEVLRPLIAAGGIVAVKTRGWSMWPALTDGDEIQLAALPQNSTPELGSIVFCQPGLAPVLHRVIAVEGDQVLVQGDLSAQPDGWVKREAIIALMLDPPPRRQARWTDHLRRRWRAGSVRLRTLIWGKPRYTR